MKRIAALMIFGLFFVTAIQAEETTTVTTAPTDTGVTVVADTTVAATPTEEGLYEQDTENMESASTQEMALAAPVPADETATTSTDPINADNLEFVSGEVSSLDEPGQSLTVKLYGEAEASPSDKTLKVTVDTSTDITDGEEDRDLKSLSVGTEVDVEYDPATNLATYIFVY